MNAHPAADSITSPAKHILAIACALLIGLPLAGCQLAIFSGKPQPRATAAPASIAPTSQPPQPGPAADQPILSNDAAPLRFTFPTPGPVPISLWRPPLYDTPWALGPYDHFYFSRPIAANEVNWPVADYRYGGVFFGSDIIHTGVDIPVPIDTPILAAADGHIVWAGYGLYYGTNDPKDPYGLAVTVRHNFGYQGQRLYTVYAHMEKILVNDGQEVKRGDVLGLVGTTGLTTGPHVHFEVRMERNSYFATLNPELWLAPPQGWGVVAGHLMNTNGSLLTQHDVTIRNKDTGQRWTVRSYGDQAVNSDPHYEENLVLSDLPSGKYEIIIDYMDDRYVKDIEIHPGAVSYFTFRGKLYFNTSQPSSPTIDDLLGTKAP
jgi:murein DD-endopeptidase MepM/ murein hydrolase activator NlpD